MANLLDRYKQILDPFKKKLSDVENNVQQTYNRVAPRIKPAAQQSFQRTFNPNSVEFWNDPIGQKVLPRLASFQEKAENPRADLFAGIKANPQAVERRPALSLYNGILGAANGLLRFPVSFGSDMGNLPDIARGEKTFSNPAAKLTEYGLTKLPNSLKFGSLKTGERYATGANYGLSSATDDALQMFKAFAYGKGVALPRATLGYAGLGGGIGTLTELLKPKNERNYEKAFLTNTGESLEKAPAAAGVMAWTNPYLEKIGGNLLTRLPLKSAGNILQGVAIDKSSEYETTPTSVAIDAIFPVAGEASTVLAPIAKKIFNTPSQAIRAAQAQIYIAIGKQLRNKRGAFTTTEKYIAGTRPYMKHTEYAGAMMGIEPYQDENGNWRVRYNSAKGLAGLGVGMGITKVKGSQGIAATDAVEALKAEARKYKSAEEFVANIFKRLDSIDPSGSFLKQAEDKAISDPRIVSLGKEAEAYDAKAFMGNRSASSKKQAIYQQISEIRSQNMKQQLLDLYAQAKGGVEITAYHGSYVPIKKFDLSKVGSNTDSGMFGTGIYFSGSPKEAGTYARNTGNVGEYSLQLKNPYIINSQADIPNITANSTKEYSQKFTKYLQDKGYDGVIDNISPNKQYVVFNPDQIKPKAQAKGGVNRTKLTSVADDGLEALKGNKPIVNFNDLEKVKQTFRTDKFDITDKEAKTLIQTLKKLGLDERNVRSFDEMKAMATDILGDPKKALQGIQTGRIKDSEVVALGNIISTSTDRIAQLTKKLKKSPNDLKLQRMLEKEEAILNQAIGKRIAGGTEAGRAVVAFRILANKTLDSVYWLSKAQKQLGGSRALKAEEIDAISTLIKNQDRLGLANFVSLLGESSVREKAVSLWKAGLLTSFRTHEANIIANTAFGALETIKDIPATGFDIARSAITGNPRAKSIGTMTGAETLKGAKRGVTQAVQYFREGIDPRDANKFENFRNIRYGDTRGGRLAQKYVDFVFRTLGAEDKIYREAAFNRSIADQVMTLSKNKQMSAGEMSALLKDPTPEMVDTAIKDAEYSTFNNANRISDAVKRAKAGDSRIAAILDVVFPFVRTPTNVLLRAVDYTPIGVAGTTVKKIIKGAEVSDRELANAFGRSATGISILAAGYLLASQGKIQGATPVREAERSQMYLEGRQPNSMLVNGKWVQISKISPVANLLIMGAALHDAEGNVAQKAYQAGLSGVKALSEQSFLKGASGAIGAVVDPEKGGQKYVESAVGGMIPNFVKDIARGTDDVMRDKDTVVDSLVAGIPGLNQSLPVKVDALGNPIAQPNLATAMFNPFNPKEVNNDPLVLEFARVGYNLNTVGDTIGNQKLTPEQQRAYQRLAGAKIRELTIPLIQSSAYQNLDVDQQQTAIDKAVNKAKAMAREEIKPQLESIAKGSDRGFKANATENEPSGKTRDGVAIIARGKDIGNADAGNKGTQVDHKTALALGGNNKRSNQMILTVEENQQKGQVETYLKNEVDKGNLTLKEAKARERNWREEYSAMKPKEVSQTTKKTDTSVVIDPSTTKAIDYTEYTQSNERTGTEKYKFERDKATVARKIYASDASDSAKQEAYSSMGLNADDVEYDYLANQTNDVKYQYLTETLPQAKTHDEMIQMLAKGRRKSMSGKYLVTPGVITEMVDAGLITKAEGTSLKNITFENGTKKQTGGKKKASTKVKKVAKPKIRKPKKRKTTKYTIDYISNMLSVNPKKLQVNTKKLLSTK